MGVLDVRHPDIEAFITAKREEGAFWNFNLSVATPPAFWKALDDGSTYSLVNPRTGAAVAEADPRRIKRVRVRLVESASG